MITPAILLEELLRFREASTVETADFKWKHEALCEKFRSQLDALGDSFLKYHHIAYVVQGPRDQGVDVLLKTSPDNESESFVGVQVKSYFELDDKDNELSKALKAGYHDARNHYGSRLSRYYIALCGDAKKHAKRISAINAEFAKEAAVRVIGPRHLLTFMELPNATLAAIVDGFLRQDDAVRSAAKREVRGYSEAEIYFILGCLTWSYENSSDQLPFEFFLHSSRMAELKNQFGREALMQAMGKFQDTALETYAEPSSTRIRAEDYPGIRAMYYDIQVRYGEDSDELFNHMFEFLRLQLPSM